MAERPLKHTGVFAELHIMYVRLQRDGHPLLRRFPNVIGFEQMRECQANSFRYAFAWRE